MIRLLFLLFPIYLAAQPTVPSEEVLNPLEDPAYLQSKHIKSITEVQIGGELPVAGRETSIYIAGQPGIIRNKKQYDYRGNIIEDYAFKSEGPLISQYQVAYNSSGRIYHYDELFARGEFLRKRYIYDEKERLAQVVQSNGFRTMGDTTFEVRGIAMYVYNDSSQLIQHSFQYEDQLISETTFEYPEGTIIRTTKNLIHNEEKKDIFIYNQLGQIKVVYHNDGDSESVDYYKDGLLKSIKYNPGSSQDIKTVLLGKTVTYYYNGEGILSKKEVVYPDQTRQELVYIIERFD